MKRVLNKCSYLERTIYPTLEDGVDSKPLLLNHTFGKSTSFSVNSKSSMQYNVVIPPETNCRLSFKSSIMPDIEIRGASGELIPLFISTENDVHNVKFTNGKQIAEYVISITTQDKEIEVVPKNWTVQ